MKPPRRRPMHAVRALVGIALASLVAATAHADLSWRLYSTPRHVLPFSLIDLSRRQMLMIGLGERTDEGYVIWSGSLDFYSYPWAPLQTFGTPPVYSLDGSPVDLTGAVVDAAHDRLLVWGGSSLRAQYGTWSLSLSTGEWTQISSDHPPMTIGSSIVYDRDGNRVLVLCGIQYSGLGTPTGTNQVYQLDLSGAPTWSILSVAGAPPVGRGYSAAALDPANHRIVMFGGDTVGPPPNPPLIPLDETWELSIGNTPTWRFLPPAGVIPDARDHAFAAADTLQDRVLITGGFDSGHQNRFGDLWSLSLSNPDSARWTALPPAGIPLSPPETSVFDTYARTMVFGGGDTLIGSPGQPMLQRAGRRIYLFYTGVWQWIRSPQDADTPFLAGPATLWKDRIVTLTQGSGVGAELWTAPLLQQPGWVHVGPFDAVGDGASIIADPTRDRVVIFGTAGTWTFSFADQTWSALATQGTPPAPRQFHSARYDPTGDRMIVYGGMGLPNRTGHITEYGDVWSLTLSSPPTWSRLDFGGTPPGRWDHAAIIDSAENRMLIYGGTDTLGVRTDIWSFSLDSLGWRQWFPTGTGPAVISRPFAVCDENRHRMLVVRDGPYPGPANEDVFALSLTGSPAWTQLAIQGFGPAQEPNRPNSSENFTGFYDNARDFLVLYRSPISTDPSETRAAQIWALYPVDWTTPVLVSLIEARVEGGAAHLVWSIGGSPGVLTVERRNDGGAWQERSSATADGSGQLRWDDPGLVPGRTYSYRLRLVDGAAVRYAGEATVTVPGAALVFAPVANPTSSTLGFTVRLPSAAGPARIELYDLAGRRVLERALSSDGADSPLVELAGAGRLRPGVYQARLIVSGRTLASVRVAVLR